jgi:hypothetical protein
MLEFKIERHDNCENETLSMFFQEYLFAKDIKHLQSVKAVTYLKIEQDNLSSFRYLFC